MSIPAYIGARVYDSYANEYGTIVGREGRCWMIQWDRPTPYLGQYDQQRPDQNPWFSVVTREQIER